MVFYVWLMPTSFLTRGGLTLRADRFGDADAPRSCCCTAADRRATPGARPACRWPAPAGARSPSTSAATATATDRPTATTASTRSSATCARSWRRSARRRCWSARRWAAWRRCWRSASRRARTAAALVLVDVAHRFELAGTDRIVAFMRGAPDGFASPDEAAAAVAAYLPHREPRGDTAGLRRNLRLRDGRWHWHWDPRLLGAPGSLGDPESRERTLARKRAAAEALTLPTLLVRGSDQRRHQPGDRRGVRRAGPARRGRRRQRRGPYGRRRRQRPLHRRRHRLPRRGAMTPAPGGLRERNRERRIAQILEATRELLREAPHESPSVERIAQRAEVAPATVFNLIGPRESIWAALVGRHAGRRSICRRRTTPKIRLSTRRRSSRPSSTRSAPTPPSTVTCSHTGRRARGCCAATRRRSSSRACGRRPAAARSRADLDLRRLGDDDHAPPAAEPPTSGRAGLISDRALA